MPGPLETKMNMTNDNDRQFWTRREISEYLRLSEKTVDNLRRRGLLHPVRVAGNSVRFRREEVVALIAERRP